MSIGSIILIVVIVILFAAICLAGIATERSNTACPNAKYRGKLLGHDAHKFVPVLARKHMERSTTYVVVYKCQLCGEGYKEHFVKHSALMFMGLTKEEVE